MLLGAEGKPLVPMQQTFVFAFLHFVQHLQSSYAHSASCCGAVNVSGQAAGGAGHSAMGVYTIQEYSTDSRCAYKRYDPVASPSQIMYLYHTNNGGGDQWIIGKSDIHHNILMFFLSLRYRTWRALGALVC